MKFESSGEMPIVDINNILDRQALWTAHDKRCPYCREALAFREIEVDHIIPSHFRNDITLLESHLELLNLPKDYDLDSIDNLLPVHGHCNREKHSALRDESFLRHFREVAKRRARKFEKIRERLAKEVNTGRDVAAVVEHVAKGTIKLEEVYDMATGATRFDSSEDVEEDDFVRLTSPHVRIECQLPSEENPAGTLVASFRSIELRGVQFQLDHTTIVRELFRGLGAPARPKLRPFLFKPADGEPFHVVRFGPATFMLAHDEITEFCGLIDRLAPRYVQAFHRVEAAFEALRSSLLAPGIYEIAKIPFSLWQEIARFVDAHDLGDGDSEWHIFDAQTSGQIKIIERVAADQSWEYRSFLDAVAKPPNLERGVVDREAPISIQWRSERHERIMRSGVGEWSWSVGAARHFVYDRLLPETNGGAAWLRKGARYKSEDSTPWRTALEQPFVCGPRFPTPESAVDCIEGLQWLYLLEHDQFVPLLVVRSTFQLLERLLTSYQLPPWSVEYIGYKLCCHRDAAHCTPQKFVGVALRRLADSRLAPDVDLLTGDIVDNVLRSVLEILRNGTPTALALNEWSNWMKHLEPLWEDYSKRTYLMRMRAEHEEAAA
jgi:hypothetical protein